MQFWLVFPYEDKLLKENGRHKFFSELVLVVLKSLVIVDEINFVEDFLISHRRIVLSRNVNILSPYT
jgi:hypothetical protein